MSMDIITDVPNQVIVQQDVRVVEIVSGTLPATRILSGVGVPSLSLGRFGDFYLDLDTA